MNEEDLIKQEFIRENIERDFRAIFEAQRLIALERIYSRASYSQTGQNLSQRRSGELLRALQNPRYSMELSGTGVIATSNIPVSYTHLDVYKRQVRGFALCIATIAENSEKHKE